MEICLVANLQTIGPTYVTDATGDIFDPTSGMLLAARIIITAGMGDRSSDQLKLHGPVPIPELTFDQKYDCYFFIGPIQQQPLPSSSFSTGKGSFIICIVIQTDMKKDFQAFETHLEEILIEHAKSIDFSDSVSGEITEPVRLNISTRLKQLYAEINGYLELAPLYARSSLFDVGLIASLPEHISTVVKQLILHPKGIQENEIRDQSVLKTLYKAGLVKKDVRNGETWVVPK